MSLVLYRVELLVFELDDIRYAVRLEAVQEVVRAVAVTPLPGAPSAVHGVIDVRGVVTPVFDLRARLGGAGRDVDVADQFILALAGSRRVALHVDRVDWMAEADDAAVTATRARLPGLPHVSGVTNSADGLVLIHDLETFLSDDEAAALDRAVATASAAGGP
ncbi:MAG: chemotaxis protein CheW [Gemmatimonadota bacterium]|nr:chemotaxis protein CheW [Gemmatimonadota bacterium]